MRRRLRVKHAVQSEKPVDPAWLTTGVIMIAVLLVFLLHLYSTVVYRCEEVISWWFAGENFGASIHQWSSLLVITLALWLYVDIIRPKPERVSVWLRAAHISIVTIMVAMSVLQSGTFKPDSLDARALEPIRHEHLARPGKNLFKLAARPHNRCCVAHGFSDGIVWLRI